MGNDASSGINTSPPVYLKEIRRQTNLHLRNMATSSQRKGAFTKKAKSEGQASTELTEESVREFVISNPGFLDEFISSHISRDRLRAWLKEKPETEEEKGTKEDQAKGFNAELIERSFRHRQILLMNRGYFIYPLRLKRSELDALIERPLSDQYDTEVESHLFPYTLVPVDQISQVFIHMVTKLFGKHAFPMPELCYFLSTLKSNYFNIEYHNYSHALSHAQSMYWILSKNPGAFTELEMKCLMISSIGHDVAHTGVNEAYIKNVASGLEKLYSSPILENHHIQVILLILQDINCNVFVELDPEDYKKVLDDIRHAILSTSLDRYKSQSRKMRHFIATDLDFNRLDVRNAAKSVMMMTCDLCASWKEWKEHKNTVWSLYKEFFNQGDKEMSFQLDSCPMMMRMNADKIQKYQIFFVENMVLPLFEITVKLFPNIKVMMDSTKENLELWKTYT